MGAARTSPSRGLGSGTTAPLADSRSGRRCPPPHSGRVPLARRPRQVRPVVARVHPVRVLAAARCLGAGRSRATPRSQHQRQVVLAGVRGLDHLPRAHPRRRRASRQCESRRGSNPDTTHWVDHVVDGEPRPTPRSTSTEASCPSCSRPARMATVPSSSQSSSRSGWLGPGPARPVADQCGSWLTRRTPREPTGHGYAGTRSLRPSPSRPIKPATVTGKAPPEADRPPSTPRPTRTDTPSKLASTTSNTIADSPPDTTSSPSATPRPSTSPASITGSDHFRNRP